MAVKTNSINQESLQIGPKYRFLTAIDYDKIHHARVKTYSFVKRFFDFFFAAISIIAFLPLFLIISILIKLDSKGPILFRQERTGKDGRVFRMNKFRSMVVDNDLNDATCSDKCTRIGKILRKTSIDELPQLFNILFGQMSFVGPRPWVPEYYNQMTKKERIRNKALPGITGLAQVKGRNGITIFDKIAYDLQYVENFSLVQDFKIICATIKTILAAKDVDAKKEGIHEELRALKIRNDELNAMRPYRRKPLVSIVIPVFNGEKVILDTIDLLWKQTYKNWEAIIVNDDSRDKTTAVLNKVKSKKIRIISLKKNSGAAKARNRGISEATGEYICFLDADDLWRPDKLEKQVEFMLEKDSAFSFTGYEFANKKGIGNGKIVRVPETINYRQALKNTTIWTSTVMFDMKKLTKKEISMPSIESEDTATWWNVLKIVEHADGLNMNLGLYRRGGKTLSSNKITAISRIWHLYRDHEKLNLFSSSINFVYWAINAVRRRV